MLPRTAATRALGAKTAPRSPEAVDGPAAIPTFVLSQYLQSDCLTHFFCVGWFRQDFLLIDLSYSSQFDLAFW